MSKLIKELLNEQVKFSEFSKYRPSILLTEIIKSFNSKQLEEILAKSGYKGMKIKYSKFDKVNSDNSAVYVVEFVDDGMTDNPKDLKTKIFVSIKGLDFEADF